MINSSRNFLFSLLFGYAPFSLAAESAVSGQLHQIESLQIRADRMAFSKIGMNNYHLAKARTWLDLALSEYYENEMNGIVQAAVGQAQQLVEGLEKEQADISMDTPMQLPGSEVVRPDLWNKIDVLKKHEQFSCGQRPVAEAEVHLVWAGHEKFESSWGHAQSYTNSAEEMISEAQTAINNCRAPIPIIERTTLSSDNLFGFGSADLDPSGLWRLNRLADKVMMLNSLEQVILVGHTDRLRSDGHQERNQILSEHRAESIKRYLVEKGFPAEKIKTSGVGSSQPLVDCPISQNKAAQVECLHPNRRVEITLRGANQEPVTARPLTAKPANPAPATRN